MSLAARFAAAAALSYGCGLGKSGLEPGPLGLDADDDGVISSDDVGTPGDGTTSADVGFDQGEAGRDGSVRDVQVADRRVAGDGSASPDAIGGGSPGSINCASTPCSLASNFCCTCPNCFPPFPTFCSPTFPGCVTGAALQCDDRTDCSGGDVCCGAFPSGAFAGTSCQASCASAAASGDVQFCNVDAECAKGTCKPLTSVPGFTGCM
jgi:hypothetical protein